MNLRYKRLKLAFDFLSATRLSPLLRKISSSKGIIFTMHRVLPDAPNKFAPNAILQITPGLLVSIINRAREIGFDVVSMDEAVERTLDKARTNPFVVLTFDDGYKDNIEFALPELDRLSAPFTTYLPTAYLEGKGLIWWQALEDIIAVNDEIKTTIDGAMQTISARTTPEKHVAYNQLYWHFRRVPEDQRVRELHILAANYNYDLSQQCSDLIIDWQQAKDLASHPLSTIGAHTVNHFELAKLTGDQVYEEMLMSRKSLEQKLGVAIEHFSYPIGSAQAASAREFKIAKEVGFKTAVTTRPGGLYLDHKDYLHALPRVSLNGLFQNPNYLDTFLTAEIFTLMNKGKRTFSS